LPRPLGPLFLIFIAMPSSSFRGTYTALVTPFRDDKIDETAFTRLLEEQIAAGIDGVIPVGTTGESATLTMDASSS
jgi:4-hydroxy-tetrahydrodipicolinate synthase